MSTYYWERKVIGNTHVVQVLKHSDGGEGDRVVAQFFNPEARPYAKLVANLLNDRHDDVMRRTYLGEV